MKQDLDPSDEKLSGLLKVARPIGKLALGFQERVWERIERLEQRPESMLDRLAGWLALPRVAFGALAAVVILAATLGAWHGASTGMNEARDRYVASVDPSYAPSATVNVK
jgi:hypothetical protein